jgi:hypothetical protein
MLHTKILKLSLLSLLLGGCATIEKGVVVGKGSVVKPGPYPPIENYWVDVRGKNAEGDRVTERVLLFKPDWDKIRKGDRIAPADYGAVDLGTALRKILEGEPVRKKQLAGTTASRKRAAKKGPQPVAELAAAKRQAPRVQEKPAAPTEPHEEADVREAKRKVHAAKTPEEQSRAWEEYQALLARKQREVVELPR